MSRWLLPTLVFLGSLGCAGASSGRSREHTRLESTIDQLEVAARKERRKVRELEYELARLETKLHGQERTAERDEPLPVPDLPVEVLDPGADPDDTGRNGTPGYGDSGEQYQVVGIDEEGYEIVYVGDAASDRSVTPETSYLARPAPPPADSAGRRPGQTTPSAPVASWDREHDRLEVTSDPGPTVDRQLARARDSNLGQRRPAAAAPADVGAPVNPPLDRADNAADNDAIAQYKRYYEALRAGNHEFAIAGFRNFIARHPNHEYADNARYWLAEAYYDKREYKVALDEFQKVRNDYPTGNKVPDAMLKIAFCHIALGDMEAARSALQEVMAHHPKSQPAVMAARRLETLGKD